MEPPSRLSVELVWHSPRVDSLAGLPKIVRITAQAYGVPGPIALLLTNDAEIRDLNARFRDVDEATDVLTFPAGDTPCAGDIAISLEYAERQATAREVDLAQEAGYLAIHGVLHLAGYDDISDTDRRAMQAEMNRAAVAAGLPPDPDWSSILHAELGPVETGV